MGRVVVEGRNFDAASCRLLCGPADDGVTRLPPFDWVCTFFLGVLDRHIEIDGWKALNGALRRLGLAYELYDTIMGARNWSMGLGLEWDGKGWTHWHRFRRRRWEKTRTQEPSRSSEMTTQEQELKKEATRESAAIYIGW